MGIFSSKYQYYYRKLLLVSYPVMLGQAGHMITGLADTFMVGHLGSLSLAAAAFANVIFTIPFVFGIGYSVGITPLVGQASGAGDEAKASNLLRHSLIFNVLLSVGISIIMFVASLFMGRMGQETGVVQLAVPFFNILNLSLIPVMLFLTLKQFTDGLGMTKPAMIVSISMNILNVFLNWTLIYGHFGMPALGMNGSAIATLIARVGMAFCMLGYVYVTPLKKYLTSFGKFIYNASILRELVGNGLPIGLQFLLEVGAFTMGSIMVGSISHQALAAHQIAISMAAFTYLMASGVGGGATIVISTLYGKKDYHDIKTAGRASFILALLFMGCCAIFFLIFRHQLPLLFNQEADVVSLATSLLAIAAIFQLSDGLQVTVLGALRGINDVNAPTWIALVSYWVIALPLCYFISIYKGVGAVGVWYGYCIGLTTAAILLLLRFRHQLNNMKNDIGE